jgi:Mg-chelatase subunit ChlD
MTKQDYTALVFVVDASGSMFDIVNDMEGAIKSLLETQQELPGKLTVDVVYFNTYSKNAYTLADPKNVVVRIQPGGGTALNDAVGLKIDSFGYTLAAMPEDERPSQVIFAIVTDGEENSSRMYSANQVKNKVKHQADVYGWNFLYLGANQDAVFVADGLGIPMTSALTWNVHDVATAGSTMNSYVTGTRSVGSYAFTDADRDANR